MSRTTAPANAGGMPATNRDRKLAASFDDFERMIVELRGTAAVLEIVEHETILKRFPLEDEVRQRSGLSPGYELLILTPSQGEAIRHATLQLRLAAERLCESYFAEMDAAAE